VTLRPSHLMSSMTSRDHDAGPGFMAAKEKQNRSSNPSNSHRKLENSTICDPQVSISLLQQTELNAPCSSAKHPQSHVPKALLSRPKAAAPAARTHASEHASAERCTPCRQQCAACPPTTPPPCRPYRSPALLVASEGCSTGARG
jgi:hypothetical protein